MKFVLDQVGPNQFVLIVPPHNRPLIDGKTGKEMTFTKMDAHACNYGGGEVHRIATAIAALETQTKRRWMPWA